MICTTDILKVRNEVYCSRLVTEIRGCILTTGTDHTWKTGQQKKRRKTCTARRTHFFRGRVSRRRMNRVEKNDTIHSASRRREGADQLRSVAGPEVEHGDLRVPRRGGGSGGGPPPIRNRSASEPQAEGIASKTTFSLVVLTRPPALSRSAGPADASEMLPETHERAEECTWAGSATIEDL